MIASKKYDLSWKDVLHGFITAFLAASLVGAIEVMKEGKLPTLEHLRTQVIIGLYGGVAYLVKKFLTNSEGKILKKEPSKIVS